MAQKGRKSLAAQVVVVRDVISTPRLMAPAHLTVAQRRIWLTTVNDQPADAFTETHAPLLELYCKHIVKERVLADEIDNFDQAWLADPEGLKRYDMLLKMAEREGRAASSLATRLRITRQAIDQQTVARMNMNAPKGRKPWELKAPAK